MVESVFETCILFEGLRVESVFEWNSHSILFQGFMVESVFLWI